ncbi:MAG: hypothetical protein EAZ66_03310 [Alphaproteobacteria bacterium]|nr:MAG: hypothetical protein EAZ66_03310 [Alphaproteobacteria bacterium]
MGQIKLQSLLPCQTRNLNPPYPIPYSLFPIPYSLFPIPYPLLTRQALLIILIGLIRAVILFAQE